MNNTTVFNNKKKFVIEEDLVKNSSFKSIKNPKPLIKWAGGKTQIIEKIIGEFPIQIHNYHEIFLGGGSVLLTLLAYVKAGVINTSGKIYAYDLNEPLIYLYKNIQSNHIDVFNKLQTLINDLNECTTENINRKPKNINEAKESKENYYYWIRCKYNDLSNEEKKSTLGSAYFIFLNKTCFRGIFRVGPNGFNVPYGNYNNPEIINLEHITEIHTLIQGVIFESCDFSKSLQIIEEDDFVYLDPPYAPETSTSFVAYTEKGFKLEDHNNLFTKIHNLNKENKKILLSNADVNLVRESFIDEKYKIESISCKRSINSKKPDSKTQEVIIKNY